MLRLLVSSAIRTASVLTTHNPSYRAFSTVLGAVHRNKNVFILPKIINPAVTPNLMASSSLLAPKVQVQQPITRTVTKFSLNKGKRKSVKAVIKRFKRLDWGIWIRTHSGRHKKLFKKSPSRKRRLRQHIFTNASQSWKLDKMVTSFWRRPKYYIDDPYEPYHKRDGYFATKSKAFKV